MITVCTVNVYDVRVSYVHCHRYHLNSGTVDMFAENLPGLPDNISPSASGGFWVAFAITRQSDIVDWLTQWPSLRRMIAKVCVTLVQKKLTSSSAWAGGPQID